MEQESTDDAIFQGFLAGGSDALHHVQGWVDAVVHLGRWRFADPEAVSQDIVLRLLTIVRSGRYARRSTFKTFVFAVARYTCVDQFRHDRLRARVEVSTAVEPEAADGTQHALAARESLELLRYVLQQLPGECRRLWEWVYVEGRSAAEVGRALGLREGTVRVRVHRCLLKARGLATRFAADAALV
jgi:RNA polymerase sigma-70 factor (ECF subfamily)